MKIAEKKILAICAKDGGKDRGISFGFLYSKIDFDKGLRVANAPISFRWILEKFPGLAFASNCPYNEGHPIAKEEEL